MTSAKHYGNPDSQAEPASLQRSFKIERIVVPTDFSEPASQALDVAIAIAKQFSASIDLIHVNQTPSPIPAGAALEIPSPALPIPEAEEVRLAVQTRLEGVARRCSERAIATGAEVVATEGNEASSIVKAASDRDADLIVMGTHGRSGLQRLVVGSVTESVLRHSSIPVLAVPVRDSAP